MSTEATPTLDFATIDWSPHSFEDPGGRIFWKEGRLFRALRGRSAEGFLRMESEGILESAQKAGLVKTWRASHSIPGYELVVEHEVIPPSPVVSEWSPTMLSDAALLFCDLSIFLAEHGLQLQDSHGWNMMFRNGHPVYVDFGSIIPLGLDELWKPLDEFINCFIHPLQMVAHHQMDYPFFLLGTQNWVPLDQAIPYLFAKQHSFMAKLAIRKYRRWEEIRAKKGPASVVELARTLRAVVKKFTPPKVGTRWSDYSDAFPSTNAASRSGWNQKQHSLHQLFERLPKGRMLDIGCNTGWYSLLAAQMGFEVVSMDTDRVCIDKLYATAGSENLPITPVVASPFLPLVSHGSRFYETLEKRFTADHTLMLALIHHLYFKQGFDVRTIVSIAEKMTRKTLVIEYVPADDYWVKAWNVPHRKDDYELAVWVRELKNAFTHVETLPSECSHDSSPVQRTLLIAHR